MPCPHYDIRIVQRSENESAVAAAAYQSGEKLFSEYDQEQKYYSHKSEIVHKEIMLPPHAPSEYTDRNTLWNAAEAVEKQWNSQLARRVILAIPRELSPGQYADLLRDYCREFFVSKGMCADFAIHDKGDGNPHAHILLTMRAMDEKGKFLPKSRKVYDLDENGERIRLPSGRWKSHKENTVDWNDQKYAEIWRQGWSDTVNRYLEAAGRTERLDLRSYARQGIDKIPTVHMGATVAYMEKKGIQTNIGSLNREIKETNRIMQSIRQMVRHLKSWIADLQEKKAAIMEALEQAKEPTLPELLYRYLALRQEERTGWTAKGQLKGSVSDFNRIEAVDLCQYFGHKKLKVHADFFNSSSSF
ncbi:conjugal transfer protein, partial [Clostridiaceae bacterium]|nr:conjugal transfer protein [Clostridiaceae bacterium]